MALGAGGFGFDMNVACSSATFAIEQAVNAVRSGTARCVLIVNPEITSAHLEWRDRDCHFIFGDVCTAIVVEAEDQAHRPSAGACWAPAVTQYSNNIRNNAGFLNRCEDTDPDARDKTFMQEGRKVFKEVVPMAAAHIDTHLADLGHTPQQMRRYWLHQANLGMNQLVMKRLVDRAVDDDIAPLILGEYANTASAGSIIAFHAPPPTCSRRPGRDLLLRRGVFHRQRGGAAALSNSFFWHDYETFGRVPRRDRPAQFAGLRTDPT
jgi:beta-ketodecanoyl-[acyl-carrier-protein] synthase